MQFGSNCHSSNSCPQVPQATQALQKFHVRNTGGTIVAPVSTVRWKNWDWSWTSFMVQSLNWNILVILEASRMFQLLKHRKHKAVSDCSCNNWQQLLLWSWTWIITSILCHRKDTLQVGFRVNSKAGGGIAFKEAIQIDAWLSGAGSQDHIGHEL